MGTDFWSSISLRALTEDRCSPRCSSSRTRRRRRAFCPPWGDLEYGSARPGVRLVAESSRVQSCLPLAHDAACQTRLVTCMQELGQEHGFSYEVRTADIDEKAIRDPNPETCVRAW